MTDHEFDRAYWEERWSAARAATGVGPVPAHPYLAVETDDLVVGSALDAGCGTGNEALWLAERGWQVTGADISASALAAAADRAEHVGLAGPVEWVSADLTSWEPGRTWDLVVTSYAHPATGQLAFYRHLAAWVAPGGTLLVVAHARGDHHGQDHPSSATATAAGVTELFTDPGWRVEASYENTRTVRRGSDVAELNDVVVRVRRLT